MKIICTLPRGMAALPRSRRARTPTERCSPCARRSSSIPARYFGYGGGIGAHRRPCSLRHRIAFRTSDLEATLVYTNKQVAGPVRAPGGPQANFAKELHLDEVGAQAAGSIRLRSGSRTRGVRETKVRRASASPRSASRTCCERRRTRIGWDSPRANGNGRGIGATWWFSACGLSEARVEVLTDGRVRVISGNPEIGTGSASQALPIIVADALGIDPLTVEVVLADTGDSAEDGGVHGSTSTFSAGQAAGAAAADARARLLDRAESLLEARRDDLDVRDGCVFVVGAPASKATFRATCRTR